jgi:hypothetical protein
MAETGWTAADLLASVRAERPTPGFLARKAAERQERADAQAEAQRQAVLEDQREQKLFLYQQMGLTGRSHAEIIADASRAADEDAEYESARATMEKIERRRVARLEDAQRQGEMLEAVTSRSQRPLDPMEAAYQRAQIAADDEARRRHAVVERAKASVRSRQLAAEPSIGVAPDGTPYYR